MRKGYIKLLVLLILSIMGNIPEATAGDVSLDPGYISGQVIMGNTAASFSTSSISTNATGGGYTASKSIGNSSIYQLTVQGGNWDYTFSSSASFTGTNASTGTSTSSSVTYNNRTLKVNPAQTVTNDYINTGAIRYTLTINGEASSQFSAWGSAQKSVSTGERTYTSFSASNAQSSHRTAHWYVPVVPNQQIATAVTVYVYCANGYNPFTFNQTVNVNPGETVEIPLNINFTCPPPPGGGGGGGGSCTTYPFNINGNVGINGVLAENFNYTSFFGAKTTNPSPYNYTYNVCAQSYTVTPTATTSFNKPTGNAEGNLRWPYLGGNVLNNRVTLTANQPLTKDYLGEAVPVSGEIRFTGTVTNADLYQYTANFYGEPRVYQGGAWVQNLPANYGVLAFTRHKTASNYKRPSQLGYFNYLSPGDWYTGQWSAQKLVTTPYQKQSSLNFMDYNNHYDGYSYTFGTPLHIESGVPKSKDFEYCFGSAIFRFRVVGGGLLSNPYVNGSGNHVNSSGKTDLVATVSGSASVSNYNAPDVEIFGPTGNYTLSTIRVYAQDGSLITFPPINVSLACNTTKIFDIPGPTLIVTSPQGELITNALYVPANGRAFSGSTIESVTVNGQAAALTPITGGNSNEVAFARDLPLADGKNTVNIVAKDVSGAMASDQIIVSVDRWQPGVTINSGNRFPNTETSIPFTVQASDQGYGYTLQVSIDGVLAGTVTAAANDTLPVPVTYSGSFSSITIGNHVITAVATDRAGNSTTATATIEIYEARDNNPPVITRLGDQAVTVEAGTAYIDAGATAMDDRDGDITPAIITQNPVNTLQPGSYAVTYNVADAAGNQAIEVTRQVTVVDTKAPVLTIPANLTVEATGHLTAINIGQATATDLFAVTITNNAPATFPVGTTLVTWTAKDANNNLASAVQTITVLDTTPPLLHGLENRIIEAVAATGSTVTFNVTATDIADPAPLVSCSALSGNSFPIGTTAVTCTARDASNNTSSGSFTIKVQDTTPPALTLPADITVILNTPVSAPDVQSFLNGASAIDAVDTAVAISSTTPNLATVGPKQVTFTALDDFGNATVKTATIYVKYGCTGQFQPPVTLLKPFKLGSTIPVKFGLCDANGTPVTNAVARLNLQQFSGDNPVGDPIEVTSTSAADTGNLFRLASDNMYLYNLYTKNLPAGTFRIEASLDDGSSNSIPLLLKQ